ncbi:flagellar biosynthetic protein FlhF [Caldicellulosiruptor owensensis OL]|uniref:Flagellar biosynthesis protein FlhF n=1 Tax=Caldicellulosiruptor owensensis (strain ATCC 700167 / DSM 13100 / OL) TaxID=632518 RepID=E4Q511_CALOW|nr:flagellar biosynthesis protein FlhF [Caldicellulosiruptor owensensis]ADQ05371.1 flagellar biosynthetic protein FlhF [Caldicellulosiruptor owensensis OL]
MRIKRYLAHDMQEALIRIKADLGKDAIILSTKKVRQKGLLGFFKKPLIEVTAACEDEKIVKKDEDGLRQESLALSLQMTQIKELEKKIDSLEKALKEVIKKEQEESQQTKEASRKNFLDVMRENLIKNGVENEIVDILLSNVSGDGSINTIVNSMYREIKNMLGSAAPLSFDSKFPRIVFFVGPTGVGKTTTIAKIAAKLMFENGKKVGFITADTYRIAAVEQLKTYAEIMNIKTKVWYEVDEYDGIIESLADSDVVLVDTAGRSHKNQEHMDELKAYVAKANPDEIFLLLSATTQPSVFKEVVNTYSFLDNYKVIITKVDEVSTYGNILNIRYFTQKPIAYITTGQNVPDDIEQFNPEQYAKLIIGSKIL